MIFRFLLIARMASKETRRGVEEEDLANVEFETSEDVEVIPTFDSMALREDLLRCKPDTRDWKCFSCTFSLSSNCRGIYAYGFEKPSAIQQRAIKPIIKGRDVIAQAQSGTGKTATFSISILQVLSIFLSAVAFLKLCDNYMRPNSFLIFRIAVNRHNCEGDPGALLEPHQGVGGSNPEGKPFFVFPASHLSW